MVQESGNPEEGDEPSCGNGTGLGGEKRGSVKRSQGKKKPVTGSAREN